MSRKEAYVYFEVPDQTSKQTDYSTNAELIAPFACSKSCAVLRSTTWDWTSGQLLILCPWRTSKTLILWLDSRSHSQARTF